MHRVYAHGSGDVAVGLFVGALLGYAVASSYEPYAHRHPYREYRHYGPRYRYYERPPRVVYAEPDRTVTRSRSGLAKKEELPVRAGLAPLDGKL